MVLMTIKEKNLTKLKQNLANIFLISISLGLLFDVHKFDFGHD